MWLATTFFIPFITFLIYWRLVYFFKSKPDRSKPLLVLSGDAFFPKVDGVATFAEHTIKELGDTFDMHVICSIEGPDTLFGAPVTRFWGFTPSACPQHRCTVPSVYILLELIRLQPDAVHLFEFSLLNLFMIVCCRFLGIKVSMSHHTRIDLYAHILFPRIPNYILNVLLTCIRTIFIPMVHQHMAVCSFLIRDLLTLVDINYLHFWPSGVDEDFSPSHKVASMRQKLTDGHPDMPLVIHVGRLALEKDSDQLPEMFYELTKYMNGRVRIAVVGDGTLMETLQSQTDHLSNVKFFGFMTGTDLYQAVASSDVFVSPSSREAYPLVFVESMKSGTPVVGPRLPGVMDTFIDDVQGKMYVPGHMDDCVHKIQYVLENRERMSKACLQHTAQSTWTHSIAKLRMVLLGMINGNLQKKYIM